MNIEKLEIAWRKKEKQQKNNRPGSLLTFISVRRML